ncbi:hypothetical protein [Caballeronia sp. dw_276]|jgi:hypothetical protein|uniref:hypothetical protein n=1 Tax=Caballeronia sp. dw_276 TaxID=2719795 RepID=UPI001BD65BE7|nr:hypothetical protein [Caballeronia sp. dw_276]
MKRLCRAALLVLACVLPCAVSHAEPAFIQGALGDVVLVPIAADCPAQSVVRQYTLIVDGSNTGITAQGCAGDPHAVSFLLGGTSGAVPAENAAAWHRLTGFPWQGNGSAFVRELSASVADADGKPVPGPGTTLKFTWSKGWRIAVAAAIAIATVALFLFLGAKTALLRDVGAETDVPFQDRTFSLARTQMAWWTAIILVSYVFEWLALGGVPALSAQPLVLMGFYSVLGVTARGVDLSRHTQFPPTTPHFFKDLTSDEGGVAVHRVQMLIFTIVVGLMFLNQVFTTCSMPRFDINTLLLLGISGATYIGFKTTEAQPKPDGSATSADIAGDAFKSGYPTGDAHP